MSDMDGATGEFPTGEPDRGTEPHLGNEDAVAGKGAGGTDALAPDRPVSHCSGWCCASRDANMDSLYYVAPPWKVCWGTKPKGQRESTWLTQPMDQDIYTDWDPETQDEWLKAQTQMGTWAPKRGVGRGLPRHRVAVCPSKRSSPLRASSGEVMQPVRTNGVGKKPPFKRGLELRVEVCEASSASKEAGDRESSEELAGNDSDLA
uniref:Uncharacterized protein n=1 Tax=Sphaerodactylus townsendi TaxID=933632 RepID=A0ACB8E6D5_9SAUR